LDYFNSEYYEIISDSIDAEKVIYVNLLFLTKGSLDSIYLKNGIVCKNPVNRGFPEEISYSIRTSFVSDRLTTVADVCFSRIFLQVKYSEYVYMHFYLNSKIKNAISTNCIEKNVFRILLFRPIYFKSQKCIDEKYIKIARTIEKDRNIESIRSDFIVKYFRH
jgi:hypothetical protein